MSGRFILNGSLGPDVTKTASTTPLISSLPKRNTSPSSNDFFNHVTSPLSILFCSA